MTGDDWVDNLHLTDPWIAEITPARIEDSLSDFPLRYADGWNVERLTLEVQGIANIGRGEVPQGDAAAKKQLLKLAAYAKPLARGLRNLGDTSNYAVMFELLRSDLDERGRREPDYGVELESLAGTVARIESALRRAASQLATRRPQPPRWTEAAEKDRRVMFAMVLAPIFERAFGTTARANNWGAGYGVEHPWPMFFRRIYTTLFPEAERLNLTEVLQEAARELPKLEAMKKALAQGATSDSDFTD